MRSYKHDQGSISVEDYAGLQRVLPSVNVRIGITRAMKNLHTYLKLLYKFRQRFVDFPTCLHEFLAAHDMGAALLQVHSLKGVAATLGMEELHMAAKKLEQQLQAGQTPAALARMEQKLEEVMAELEQVDFNIIEAEDHCAYRKGTELPGLLHHWYDILQELYIPLQKLQVSKIKEHLGYMCRQHWPEPQACQLAQLRQMVRLYQYKPAAEYVETLLQRHREQED